LYGYRVDGVIANRVFPAAGADNWRRQWVAAQRGILEEVADSFRPLPIWESPYRACEPVGVEELAAFAVEMYGGEDPFARATDETSLWVDRHIDTDGRSYTLSLSLPHATANDVELARRGDELIVTVGSYRRVLPLPAALARAVVSGARLDNGRLQVRFAPQQAPTPRPAAREAAAAATATAAPAVVAEAAQRFVGRDIGRVAHGVGRPAEQKVVTTEGNR